MALSFVVTGTIWRWLLQFEGGINILPTKLFGWDKLEYRWIASTHKDFIFSWAEGGYLTYLGIALFAFALFTLFTQRREMHVGNILVFGLVLWLIYAMGYWEDIWPPVEDTFLDEFSGNYGYNAAMSGIIIAATWQMAGYVMALFLAGIRGIPEELREAARVDGCAEWQVYTRIVLPQLRPIILSAVIILGHISLKIFDLVFSMSGPDNEFTVVPGVYLYTSAFRGNQPAKGAAIATILLVLVSLVVIPYLWSSLRSEKKPS